MPGLRAARLEKIRVMVAEANKPAEEPAVAETHVEPEKVAGIEAKDGESE